MVYGFCNGGGHDTLVHTSLSSSMMPVILSAAKNPLPDEGFFAALRMTGIMEKIR